MQFMFECIFFLKKKMGKLDFDLIELNCVTAHLDVVFYLIVVVVVVFVLVVVILHVIDEWIVPIFTQVINIHLCFFWVLGITWQMKPMFQELFYNQQKFPQG